MKPWVFISYGSKCGRTPALIAGLRLALGDTYNFVVDTHHLRAGDDVPGRLARWLEACDAAILLLSEAAFASDWVAREAETLCRRQRALGRVTVLPVGVDIGDEGNGAETWSRICGSDRLKPAGLAGLPGIKCGGIDSNAPDAINSLVALARGALPQGVAAGRDRAAEYTRAELTVAHPAQLLEACEVLDIQLDAAAPDDLPAVVAKALVTAPADKAAAALGRFQTHAFARETLERIWERIRHYWLDEHLAADFVGAVRAVPCPAQAPRITLLMPASHKETIVALGSQAYARLPNPRLDWFSVVIPTNVDRRGGWLSRLIDKALAMHWVCTLEKARSRARRVDVNRPVCALWGLAEPRALVDAYQDYPELLILMVHRPAPPWGTEDGVRCLQPLLKPDAEQDAIERLAEGESIFKADIRRW